MLSVFIIVAACGTATVTNPPAASTSVAATPTTVTATPSSAPATPTVPAATLAPGATATAVAATPTAAPATPTAEATALPPLEPATVNLWVHSEGKKAFLNELVKEFNNLNPGVTVVVTEYPEANYPLKLQTALAAGAGPDLGYTGIDEMRQGLMMPLEPMVQEYGLDLSTYAQSIVKGPGDFSCAYNNTLYCLGSLLGSVQMFYNKDMFAAAGIPNPDPWPPMTVDQFITDACQLTNTDAGVWGAAYGETILPWEMAVSPDGRTATGYINGQLAVSQYDLLAKGVRDSCAPSWTMVDPWEQGADLFSEGKLAMVVTDFLSLTTIEGAGINYGVTAPPNPPGIEPFFDTWSDNVGIFASTTHQTQAERFLYFLTTRGQELQVTINGNVPLDSKVAERMDWAQGIPGREDGLVVLEHSRVPVFIPDKWNVWGPFYDDIHLMASGDMDAQAAMDDAASKIQPDLDNAWHTWEAGGTPTQ